MNLSKNKKDWVMYFYCVVLMLVLLATIFSIFLHETSYTLRGSLGIVFLLTCILPRKLNKNYLIISSVNIISSLFLTYLFLFK